MKKMNNKKIFLFGGIFSVVIVAALIFFVSSSMSAPLENDVRVEENSNLTYYLDILYDGKDKDVVTSSSTATASLYSDYIYVEDKIPDGLTFLEFVNSSDGSIGAVMQGDSSKVCPGYVVDGFGGLSYDANTRTVSFKVKNLKAGCKLTVGIVTRTPSLGDKKRMDFYNTFYARENDMTEKSNTVHVYLGREDATLYNVTYEYTGTIPENAPKLPDVSSYASGTSVGVINDISLSGYTFSGWTSSDVTLNNNSFIMPEANVVLKGSFTKNPTYKVSYSINGEKPDSYIPPKDKEYGKDEDVTVDSLKPGDVVDGYRFLGWTPSSSVTIVDDIFKMPEEDVNFVGTFEKITYKVTYKFQGTVIPPNADSLLPKEEYYGVGEIVNLAKNPVASGYRFLGWYKKDKFMMPEEDVIIYGEWMKINGEFSPIITKKITNPKDKYTSGDTVLFEITVENTADFSIHDVLIQEDNEISIFVEGDNYTVLNPKFVKIDTIDAHGKVTLKAQYKVPSKGTFEEINTVVLTGALADNDMYLDTSKEYKSSVKFNVENKNEIDLPSTLDAIVKYVLIFVVSLIVLALIFVYVVKTKNNDKKIILTSKDDKKLDKDEKKDNNKKATDVKKEKSKTKSKAKSKEKK